MAKLTKNQKEAQAKIETDKLYSVDEASALVKEITTAKFDASVDLAVRLGVDPKKANQMVRGVVTLPHGTGKDVKVLALVTPDKEAEAAEAGADFVGLDEYLDKINPQSQMELVMLLGLWGEGNFEKTMQFIVNYGRDNDTVAAVAGTILGAKLGYQALPPQLRETIIKVNRENMGMDLEVLALEMIVMKN